MSQKYISQHHKQNIYKLIYTHVYPPRDSVIENIYLKL